VHVPPPQSTSVSAPLRTPSVHAGAWQTFPVQTPLVQSAPVVQPWPGVQSAHVPPQSTSVSVPLRTPSLHAGAWQTFPVQTSLVQSAPVVQSSPG
jgi:hypothetical protein